MGNEELGLAFRAEIFCVRSLGVVVSRGAGRDFNNLDAGMQECKKPLFSRLFSKFSMLAHIGGR